MASHEAQLRAIEADFKTATTEEQRAACAKKAGAVLATVEGDVFSSADEVRASLTQTLGRDLVGAMTVATPASAATAIKAHLQSPPVLLDGDGRALEALCAKAEAIPGDAQLARAVASCFRDEALAAGDGRCMDGAAFEARTALHLLSVHALVPFDAFAALVDNRPRLRDPFSGSVPAQVKYFRDVPQSGFEAQCLLLRTRQRRSLDACVAIVEKTLKSKGFRPGVLAWLSRVLAFAQPLTLIKIPQDRVWHPRRCATPAFLLNAASLILRLAAPLWTKGLSNKVDWRYALRHERVSFKDAAPLFSSGASTDEASSDEDEDEEALLLKQALKMSMAAHAAPLGFFPPDVEFSFITEVFFLAHRAIAACLLPLWGEYHEQSKLLYDLSGRRGAPLDEAGEKRLKLHSDGWVCALEDPRLLEDAGAFSTFAVEWLLVHLEAPDGKERAAKLPASLVKDACDVWTHLARAGARTGISASRSGQGATFRPAEASRAILICCDLMRNSLVESPLVQAKLVAFIKELMHPPRRGSPRKGRGASLSGAVLDSERVRRELPQALAHLYCEVQAVAGMDVDSSDSFDKFSIRQDLNRLLMVFWRYPLQEPRKALLAFFGRSSELGLAMLDTIIYCGEDALGCLAGGASVEKDNKPPTSGRNKQFWQGQKGQCRAFLPVAELTLELLGEFCVEDDARKALLGPVLSRCAALIKLTKIGTVKGLEHVSVADAKKEWGFDAARLLESVGNVVEHARLCHGDATWARAVDAVLDDDSTLDRPLLKEASTKCAALAKTMEALQKRVPSDVIDARPLVAQAQGPPCTEKAYEEALAGEQLKIVDSLRDHVFASKATGAPNAKAMQKELRKLGKDLPEPHVDGSVFVRFDESRLDLCRCAITGPVNAACGADTPYAYGFFVFDVWFPPTFPSVPPLVEIVTTGGGTYRFNPNLYADGKVCLSLLGTWKATDESEKWDPATGSLRQILLSIQHQILVSEPYFNEPGRDVARGTSAGKAASSAHNLELRNATLRYAVADQLQSPPVGLEEVCEQHFALVAPDLLRRCAADLASASPEANKALHRAAAALAECAAAPPAKRRKSSESGDSP